MENPQRRPVPGSANPKHRFQPRKTPGNWEKRAIERKSPENLGKAKITGKYQKMEKPQRRPVRGQRKP